MDESLKENLELQKKIEEWLKFDHNDTTRQIIMHLVELNDSIKLKELMLTPLKFGTAGLRAKMNAGFSNINDVTMIQTTQGLLKYLEECPETKEILKEGGVVIGYDGRYHSSRWGHLIANIFMNAGIKTYLFSRMCPTPFVPFALKHYKCVAGIMITASHNPREYNGFKLYWTNGVQLISPHDKNIAALIEKNYEPWATSWSDPDSALANPLCHDPMNEILKSYLAFISERLLYKQYNEQENLKIAFTPLHGVGWFYMQKAFEVGGFKSVFPTPKQLAPDANFPTLDFPNPEEGKFVMKLGIETAFHNGCSLLIATDPDADRMAMVEKQKNDSWYFFNGNEQGTLLGWWAWHSWVAIHSRNKVSNNEEKCPPESGETLEKLRQDIAKIYVVCSTVSSHMLKRMAKQEGFNYAETLTGFKWIGNKADDLMKQGFDVIFAYEEAIGYMCDSRILDKDGISAGIFIAEMASYLKAKEQKTLFEKLQDIYSKYGYNICFNSYLNCYDPKVIETIFDGIRNWDGKPNSYPTKCGDYNIQYIRDLTTGYDNSQPDNKAVLPSSKSNQMITFTFELLEISVTLRASGTEPKIKYYSELHAPAGVEDVNDLRIELKKVVKEVIDNFLEPGVNNISYPDLLPDQEDTPMESGI